MASAIWPDAILPRPRPAEEHRLQRPPGPGKPLPGSAHSLPGEPRSASAPVAAEPVPQKRSGSRRRDEHRVGELYSSLRLLPERFHWRFLQKFFEPEKIGV